MKTRQDKPDKTNAVIKKTYSLVSRLLAALFGAVLFAIIVPVSYWLIFDGMPTESFLTGIATLIVAGLVIGAVLGALFPRFFGFVFEIFIDDV